MRRWIIVAVLAAAVSGIAIAASCWRSDGSTWCVMLGIGIAAFVFLFFTGARSLLERNPAR